MKASVNYVGKSSMIIGIRVESENPHRNNKYTATPPTYNGFKDKE
jgi:acyl-CoA hydrolase